MIKSSDKRSTTTTTTTTNYLRTALQAIAAVLLLTAFCGLCALTVAGSQLLDALRGQTPFQFASEYSFLLFPSQSQIHDSIIGIDVVYSVLWIYGYLACLALLCRAIVWQSGLPPVAQPCALGLAVLAGNTLMHLFGNLHYQFYCAVGEIDTRNNCDWMFNCYTFFAGFAGLLLLTAATTPFLLVGYVLVYAGDQQERRRLQAQRIGLAEPTE
jgi:hypothetical protein